MQCGWSDTGRQTHGDEVRDEVTASGGRKRAPHLILLEARDVGSVEPGELVAERRPIEDDRFGRLEWSDERSRSRRFRFPSVLGFRIGHEGLDVDFTTAEVDETSEI